MRFRHYQNTSFYSTNVNHFLYLEELWIDELGSSQSAFFRNEMLIPILQLNPKLKSLCVISEFFECSTLIINLVRSTLDSLKNLETLKLKINPITSYKGTDDLIHMKSVKSFEINFDKLIKLAICFIPFSFSQFRKFIIFYPKEEFHSSFTEEF